MSTATSKSGIFKKIIWLMLPVLVALILQTLYGIADVLIVGRFGSSDAISAITTASNFINMVTFVISSLSVGITIVIRRYLAENKQDRLSRVIGGSVTMFAIIAVLLTILIIVFADEIVLILNAPISTIPEATEYMRICGAGILFITGYNLMSSIFRGLGDYRHPILFISIACVINIVGDYVLVAICDFGIQGAAMATVAAQAISFVISLCLCKRMIHVPIKLSLADFKLGFESNRVFTNGLPIAIQEFLTQISFLAILFFVNGMGSTEAIRLASSSGYGIASKIAAIVMLVPSALVQSLTIVIAENVNKGNEKEVEHAMGLGMLIGAGIGIVMTAVAYFGGHTLASLFTTNPDYQLKAAEYLQGYGLEAIFTSVLFSFTGYFGGHHKQYFVVAQDLVQAFLVRVPLAYLMTHLFPDSMIYVGFCSPCATIVGIIITVIYYLWYTKRISFEEEI